MGEIINKRVARRANYLLGSKLDQGDLSIIRLIKEEALHQESVIRTMVSYLVVKGANMRWNKNDITLLHRAWTGSVSLNFRKWCSLYLHVLWLDCFFRVG